MSNFDLESWLAGASSPANIEQAGAAVLRRRATDVDPAWFGTAAWMTLLERMVDTMRRAPGVGLAAPQIGVPWRVFVAEDREENMASLSPEEREARHRVALPLLVIVNPVLTRRGAEVTFYEGCLSVRGYGALVPRASDVEISGLDGLDASGQPRPLTLSLSGWPARIAQHEVDHLDGTLYIDRMVSRSFASAEHLPGLASVPPSELLRRLASD
jgi:peptide deformylase